MLSRAKSERHYSQHGIEATVCHVKGAIDYKQVIVIVDAAPFVCN